MFTTVDERNGLIKQTWEDVRSRVAQVEPEFASLVDDICPDKSFTLYLAYYPYGSIKGDACSTLFPDCHGGYYRVTDPHAPDEVVSDLHYSKNTAPFGLLLEKSMELFFEIETEKISMPWLIYRPGSFLSLERTLKGRGNKIYAPNGLLHITSGARSTFLLPMIGCQTHHANLQRDFQIRTAPPKSLHDHWNLFRQITNNKTLTCDWRSCILYFSGKWIHYLLEDSRWSLLRTYLYEKAWRLFEYARNKIYYDIAFSFIQKKRNLKPNPYLVDMAKHAFTIAMGNIPGYMPATNDDMLPLELLQKVFINSYGLKKYYPHIMIPGYFDMENHDNPYTYCSLKYPPALSFAPKSRRVTSTLQETRELERLLQIFSAELSRDDGLCSDTFIKTIAEQTEFRFFHNEEDPHGVILHTNELPRLDKNFHVDQNEICGEFGSDAPFLRGCVSIQKKQKKIDEDFGMVVPELQKSSA